MVSENFDEFYMLITYHQCHKTWSKICTIDRLQINKHNPNIIDHHPVHSITAPSVESHWFDPPPDWSPESWSFRKNVILAAGGENFGNYAQILGKIGCFWAFLAPREQLSTSRPFPLVWSPPPERAKIPGGGGVKPMGFHWFLVVIQDLIFDKRYERLVK